MRLVNCRAYFKPLPSSLVAVTGTNGKTSVATFLRQIWQASGKNAASIGTLGVHPKDLVSVPELTSPDAVTLHRALSGLKKAGIDHVAMEASSHGLDQNRLHGLTFSAAGFTNLTQDHWIITAQWNVTWQPKRACFMNCVTVHPSLTQTKHHFT